VHWVVPVDHDLDAGAIRECECDGRMFF
jgi:hypothetical protein